MNLTNIYHKTRSILFHTNNAWEEIFEENISRKSAIFGYLLPMSLLIGLSSLLGSIFSGEVFDASSVSYILFSCFISFLIVFLEVYLAGWLITEVASSYNPDSGSDRIFNLVIFSHAPFYISLAFIKLFPQLLFAIVAGFYSFYIYWLGIEKFGGVRKEYKTGFLIISVAVMLLTYTLLTLVFNSLYDVIIDQFVSFGRP